MKKTRRKFNTIRAAPRLSARCAGSRRAADLGSRNAETSFRGERRSNATHASTSDSKAKLYRKGPGMEARLAFLGHVLMESRHGVDACLTRASGHAERLAALAIIERQADRPSRGEARGRQGLRRSRLRERAARHERAPTRRAEQRASRRLGDRPAHDTPSRLRGEPAHPQADRGGVRLDEDDRWHAATDFARHRARLMGLHLRGGRLQSGGASEALGSHGGLRSSKPIAIEARHPSMPTFPPRRSGQTVQ